MSTQQSTQLEIIDAVRKAQMTAIPLSHLPPDLAKATFDQGTNPTGGLTYYDLEPGAKSLYPVLTPLRNAIPRVSGAGGIQAAWRAITGINTSGMRIEVSAGNRGGVQVVSTADYTAAYKGIGQEGSATFEAQYAAQPFADVRAKAALTTLQSLMLGEEAMILGGNTSLALGTTPTPTLSGSATGGTLPAATYSVICVAMALHGVLNGSVAGGIQSTITRTNADGSSDIFGGGSANKSTAATGTTTGTTSSIAASVAPVNGALGYAWFWGPAGSEALGAITTISSYLITAPATGTQTATSLGSTDRSTSALAFDGLLTQAMKAGSGAYILTQPPGTAGVGTPLTADGAGGVVEIDQVLAYMWDNFRLSPDSIWCNTRDAKNISRKIVAGSANSALKFQVQTTRDAIGGGIMVRTYLNSFGMAGPTTLDIKVHPNMPAGTLLFTTGTLPYQMNDITNVMQIRTRQEYYQIEWPLRTRKYEYGVYADEVLQHFFPPSMAVITNIGQG